MDILHNCYKKNENIVSKIIDDMCILVPMKNNVNDTQGIFYLNEVGMFIWNNIDGKKTLSEIRDLIIENFDATREESGQDLIEFIEQLENTRKIVLVK